MGVDQNAMKYDEMLTAAGDFVIAHHVSIGDSPARSDLLPPANGSGTFVRFRIERGTIYGILTAAHVIMGLTLGRNEQGQSFMGLSKPLKGETSACSVTFPLSIFSVKAGALDVASEESCLPDVVFVVLGVNRPPDHELFHGSLFYDLDKNVEFGFDDDERRFSVFFRGACPDLEISDEGLMPPSLCIGGGEVIKHDTATDIQYWKIPNTSKETICGASGAGFWRFTLDNRVLRHSLEGVITSEVLACSSIEAIAAPYLYDDFLPMLKTTCMERLA